jgi:hypothetical protein
MRILIVDHNAEGAHGLQVTLGQLKFDSRARTVPSAQPGRQQLRSRARESSRRSGKRDLLAQARITSCHTF